MLPLILKPYFVHSFYWEQRSDTAISQRGAEIHLQKCIPAFSWNSLVHWSYIACRKIDSLSEMLRKARRWDKRRSPCGTIADKFRTAIRLLPLSASCCNNSLWNPPLFRTRFHWYSHPDPQPSFLAYFLLKRFQNHLEEWEKVHDVFSFKTLSKSFRRVGENTWQTNRRKPTFSVSIRFHRKGGIHTSRVGI